MAYSEFMPPPRLGKKPYNGSGPTLFRPDDPLGWPITEYEEAFELQPGLSHLAAHLVRALEHLGCGRPAHHIGRVKLEGNPFWPPELARAAGTLAHERYVVLAPLALSRTQDDKGRVRWTLFGGSEQGPERGFWKGLAGGPGCGWSADDALDFLRRLLGAVYGESSARLADLRRLGFRILPQAGEPILPYWQEDPLPAWTAPYLLREGERLGRVKYLLTFRPFGSLPRSVQRAYLAGDLHLLPFPGSLLFWGAQPMLRLQRELPLAMQISLLHLFERHEHPYGLRIPQSGWMHEHRPDHPLPEPGELTVRNTYRRTHRWGRIHRHEDELAVAGSEDRVAHVLFSASPDDVGLYGKPMARNAQMWTRDFHLLLDGPRANRKDLERAAAALREGGLFGYRFQFPAMLVGRHEVYWHRPLVAYLSAQTSEPEVFPDAPLGYLTAYLADRPNLARPIELWPRLLARGPHVAAVRAFAAGPKHRQHHEHRIARNNARKLLDTCELLGGRPLPRSFARALLHVPRHTTLGDWLHSLEELSHDRRCARELIEELHRRIEAEPTASTLLSPIGTVASTLPSPVGRGAGGEGAGSEGNAILPANALTLTLSQRERACGSLPANALTLTLSERERGHGALPEPLTYHRTARRSFEVAYWKTIARLATGRYLNKDNADCVRDAVTRALLRHHHRDLEALGDYLLAYYKRTIERAGMAGKAIAGDLPFQWQTDFDFPWSGGWLENQQGKAEERDLLVMIPGQDRRRAVIMADHYDTAYMEDRYEKARGGNGARLAAAGADDNHSATATLMLGAPVFLELSRAGLLGCDVWLVHLTGEEFPSDCMGARHLAQWIVEGSLRLRVREEEGDSPIFAARKSGQSPARKSGQSPGRDLSNVRVQGVYVLDMIAHNNDHERDVFQLSPGAGAAAMRLAQEAHLANVLWNAHAPAWNRRAGRRGCGRGQRSDDGTTLPGVALHPQLDGEIRPPYDSRSSLFNTDGQIFCDAGIPAVLLMENYDINRVGYHDTHDTMANIDLDYGAAVAAIAIEAVARAAR